MEDAVDQVLAHLVGVRRSGAGWLANCPAHDDRRASLSIAEGDDGRVLAKCHAGCGVEAIVAAVGLGMGDLFRKHDDVPRAATETIYEIRNATGVPQAKHVRWDEPGGGKRLRWRRSSGAWGLGGRRTATIPLYGSERVASWPLDSDPVFVVEGEKATDALLAAGRRAVGTVTGAAIVPEAEVLAFVAGRPLILCPDNDPAGSAHMLGLAARFDIAADRIRWLDTSGWPDKADLADILAPGMSAHELHGMATNGHRLEVDPAVWDAIDARVELVPPAEGTDTTDRTDDEPRSDRSVPQNSWPTIEPLRPDIALPAFPVDALPAWMAAMVKAVAANTETESSMAAVTALGLASVPLANRFRVHTPTWEERSIGLFTAAIADSGELKSAVFAALDEPLRDHERQVLAEEHPVRRDRELARKDIEARSVIAREELKKALKAEIAARAKAGLEPEGTDDQADMEVHDESLMAAQARVAAARAHLHAVEGELAVDEEEHLAPYALLADDTTQEALQRQMAEQDGRTGIVSAESELFAMAAGRYADKGPNLQVYLAGFSGDPLRADRITRKAPPVERPGLAIVISTQPVVLEQARRNEHFVRRGLLARFLFAVPASRAGSRHLADRPAIPVAVAGEYRDRLQRLCRLADAHHASAPVVLLLIGQAARTLEAWHDAELEPRRDRERGDLGASDAMAAWGGRLHGLVVRIAALLHVAEHEANAGALSMEASVVERAISIGTWATDTAFAAFGIDRLDRVAVDALRVRRWYVGRDDPLGAFTVREACRGQRGLEADRVRAAVQRLEMHGYVRVERTRSGAWGGRPSDLVTINPADRGDA